jgi:Domain of unknown function (DUF5668)
MLTRRSLVLPLVLIGIGVVALLANVGVLSADAIDRTVSLWPLILVLVGAELIVHRVLPPASARIAGLALLGLMLAVVVAYAALGPRVPSGSRTFDAAAPRQDVSRANLVLDASAAQVDVRAASLANDLYRVHVEYPANQGAPSVALDRESGRVTVEQNQSPAPFFFGGGPATSVRVDLSDQVAWAVDLGGGAYRGAIDLDSLQLTGIHVSGGAANLDLRVGGPKGKIPLDFSGGAFNITVHVPAGTALEVSVSGGANDVDVDGHHMGAFGQDTYSSPAYSAATDGYAITLSGGASHARVVSG